MYCILHPWMSSLYGYDGDISESRFHFLNAEVVLARVVNDVGSIRWKRRKSARENCLDWCKRKLPRFRNQNRNLFCSHGLVFRSQGRSVDATINAVKTMQNNIPLSVITCEGNWIVAFEKKNNSIIIYFCFPSFLVLLESQFQLHISASLHLSVC